LVTDKHHLLQQIYSDLARAEKRLQKAKQTGDMAAEAKANAEASLLKDMFNLAQEVDVLAIAEVAQLPGPPTLGDNYRYRLAVVVYQRYLKE